KCGLAHFVVRLSEPEALAVECKAAMGKSYRQYCPIAHALDVVGERWSLLIVRELSHGPLRYTDLLDRLHGCGTNVLAARLRGLEQHGVVARRRLPPPAASTVYELTAVGQGLEPVLHALCSWGLRTLGPPNADDELVPGWLERALGALAARLDPGLRLTVRCGGEVASIAGGAAVAGALDDAHAVVAGEPAALYELIVHGDVAGVEIDGSVEAAVQLARAFAEPESALAAPAAAR